MALAKASLAELANRTRGGERFRLLRRGKPIAALVAVEDLGRIERSEVTAGFVAAARRFAASLPPEKELPDLADVLPPRTSYGRRRSKRR
jgi:antitoxin (DNA-binding transcriptional repressor) of toxin-antitoxin stability system